jgi:hypothetical protein
VQAPNTAVSEGPATEEYPVQIIQIRSGQCVLFLFRLWRAIGVAEWCMLLCVIWLSQLPMHPWIETISLTALRCKWSIMNLAASTRN